MAASALPSFKQRQREDSSHAYRLPNDLLSAEIIINAQKAHSSVLHVQHRLLPPVSPSHVLDLHQTSRWGTSTQSLQKSCRTDGRALSLSLLITVLRDLRPCHTNLEARALRR